MVAQVRCLSLVLVIAISISAVLSFYFIDILAQPLVDQNSVSYEKKSNFVKEFKIPVSERDLNGITTDNEGNVWIHHATNKSSTLFKMSKEDNNFTKYSIYGKSLSDNAVINLAGGQLVFDNVGNAIWFTDARTNSL